MIHIPKGIVALPGAAMISKSIYAFVSICDGWGRRLLATGPHVQNFTTVAASVVVAMPVSKKGRGGVLLRERTGVVQCTCMLLLRGLCREPP